MVAPAATPLDRVVDLGESLIAKLHEAGVTTVEALADMTPEQLEELPGVGPKTVEKISLAVNNYYSSLETGQSTAAEAAAPAEIAEAAQETAATPDAEAEAAPAAEGEKLAAAEASVDAAPEEAAEQPAEQKMPSGGEDS
jgi:transcription termination/antitermination protein NusA